MRNLGRNTAMVLVLTLFTGLAVFAAVQLGGRLFGASDANAQSVSAPAAASQGYDSGGGSSGGGQIDSYGYGDSNGSGSSTGATMTCPATGCSASSCHALQ